MSDNYYYQTCGLSGPDEIILPTISPPSLPEIEAAREAIEDGDFSKLSDIKVDFKTGRIYIDEETFEAVLIYGVDVAIQNLGIKFNTQIGTVKRQGLDDFGWDKRGRIKQKKTIDNITTISNKLTELALNDPYVEDATVETADSGEDEINFLVNVLLIDGNWYSVPVTIN